MPSPEATRNMAASTDLHIERATGKIADEVIELFVRCDAPCHCQFFQFSGDNRDWQMRCGVDREANARALRSDLEKGQLHAFVAMTGGKVVGWMRLDHPESLGKRYQGRLYRGLPCFDGDRHGTISIVCFLVDPELRTRGVAKCMLQAGMTWAQEMGYRALEAFPRGAQDVTPEEQWTGPVKLYEQLGFRKIHDFEAYPVFRWDFDSSPQD